MKRGISPLIATVLLIGATIMIAAIVSTFIINQTKKFEPEKFMGESSYCQDVVLGTKIINSVACDEIPGRPDCMSIQNLALVNKGVFKITKVDVNAVGLGSGAIVFDVPLMPSEIMCRDDQGICDLNKLFKPGICKDKSVRIIPHINIEGEEIVCTQSEMIINAENSGCFN